MKPVTIDPRYHDAVIFDLDGFVADITALHAAAWKKTLDHYLTRRPANESEDHSPFAEDDYRRRVDGKPPLDGLADFLASRGISLPRGTKADTSEETVCGLGNREQESETATDGEVRAMEVKLIRDTGANNPAIGYNIWPRWPGTSST